MIQLLLKSKKKQTKDGRKFRTYFTDVNIVVKGEEEKGKQRKTITVKFDKAVDTSKLIRGILTCKESDIDLPFKYHVQVKDGKEVHSHIYVRAYDKYEERKGASTIEFITEENETEDAVIDDDAVETVENENED